MLNKITGKVNVGEQMLALAEEAEKMIAKYGWEERTVAPWEHTSIKVTKIVADCKDYYECTRGTKEYLVSLINGLVPILNAWEEYELQPKITVRAKATGKVLRISKELYVIMAEADLVELL